MKKSLIYLFAVCAAVSSVLTINCCAHSNASAIEDAPQEIVCKLKSDGPIDKLMSICIIDDTSFIVTANTRIMMFNMDGTYIRDIGRNGRAKGEFIRPKQARFDGNNLIVWDSNQTKFIKYSREGEFLDEYPYSSAFVNFQVSGGIVYIYAPALHDDYILDVLNLSDLTTSSAGLCSETHKILTHFYTSSPLYVDGKKILFAPLDKLTVFSMNGGSKEHVFKSMESKSFKVLPTSNSERDIGNDMRKFDSFVLNSSYNVFLFERDGSPYLVSMEGSSSRGADKKISEEGRFYSLYRIDGHDHPAKHYRMGSMGNPYLFAEYNGDLFYIKTEVDGNDEVVILCKLSNVAYK